MESRVAGATSRLLNDSSERMRVRVPVSPPLLTPEKAYKLAIRIFHENGFLTIRKSKFSIYLKRKGSNSLVRLSDHEVSNSKLSRVKYNIIFNYQTIKSDVETRCQSVIRNYR